MATHADQALDLLHDADPRERTALGGFEYSTNQVVLHTDERVSAAAGCRAGVVERRPGRLRPARAGADDDLPHEPAAVAARAGRSTACRSTPATASDPSAVIVERAMSHPTYTFRTLEAQAGSAAAAGPAVDLVRRRAPRLRLPRGWLPVRAGRPPTLRPGCGDGARGMRSHLLEGVVRHRRVRPFAYALEHRRVLRRARPRRARRGPAADPVDQPRPLEPAVVP